MPAALIRHVIDFVFSFVNTRCLSTFDSRATGSSKKYYLVFLGSMAPQVKQRSGKGKSEKKGNEEQNIPDDKGRKEKPIKKEALAGDKFGSLGIKKNDQLWSRYISVSNS